MTSVRKVVADERPITRFLLGVREGRQDERRGRRRSACEHPTHTHVHRSQITGTRQSVPARHPSPSEHRKRGRPSYHVCYMQEKKESPTDPSSRLLRLAPIACAEPRMQKKPLNFAV